MKKTEETVKPNFKALLPFLIFIVIYLGSGIILQIQGVEMAFYQFPAPVAVSCGVISAFFIIKGSIDEKFDTFVKGCGNSNIIIMCIIYLLAGAFANVCKQMGGVDSTVNLGLTYIPPQFIVIGIFLISSFISTATGTSVGSIAAVGPIAVAISEKSGASLPLIMACVLGGAMLGDNLSIISDTTIASTRTQGCEMKDKFKINAYLSLVPAIITIVLLFIFGKPEVIPQARVYDFNLIKVLPYLFVLVLAVAGMNVFLVLTGGIFLAGAIGLYYGDLTILSFVKSIYTGFTNMTDIFLLSMLTGGLAELVTKAGGIEALLQSIQKFIKGKKSAEIGIGVLVALTDIAVANNTVAIIINGPVAKKLCYRYKVDPRRSAAILSTVSSIFQGFIPYGAQMLILTSFAKGKVSPMEIMPLVWFCQLLLVATIVSTFIPFANKLIKKDPWDFEKEAPVSKVEVGEASEECLY
ncbi:Na+/H+ antiporter NhaC family protein [Eubacterium multiforme]|uniref:Na+/H+ antiporter NhaC n=1 Tax=Eubacterium multiforme TaxID=83339 RepID=A0ABT9UWC4_9FIRM|nr:Na+/H+ antiporter NhaC family protein [Eubacterium multiforme]MDQ0150596.1 Na+/H+ antiporter NhaC [Eubacterium multiforme]